MNLKLYNKKRSFEDTSEPKGKLNRKANSLHFVVQKHAASHLHYDFRLQAEGTLKSWAIPKGPSLNPAEKHLAVMVEDHPYDYLQFEGTIPAGNYGAGTVMVWDEGFYTPINDKGEEIDEKSFLEKLKSGKITFVLEGQKLKGRFSLVRMKNMTGKDNWLFIKSNDEYATTSTILDQNTSVLSGRSMDEITDSEGHEWQSNRIKSPEKKQKKKAKNALPTEIHPMLAFLVDEPFDGKEWIFETKWDGYRAIAEMNNDKVNLYSRNFLSFNARFKALLKPLKQLGVQAILDGEIVVFNSNGISSFQDLQNYQKTGKGDLYYMIFDFLYFEGHDLRELPLSERKKLLKKLLSSADKSLCFSEHVLGKGKKAFHNAEKQGEEGIVAKKINSPYSSKRSRDWLKIKTHARQEAIICGFTKPTGSREEFGALVVGVYKDNQLHFAGHVGGGFDREKLRQIKQKLDPLITTKCPFEIKPKTNTPVTWVKPILICEVSFQEWTAEDHMRQPIFQGLRTDKEAKEVKQEIPLSSEDETKKTKKSVKKSGQEPPLTHLDKVYWPKEGYTKGMLIDYYREVADYILPYLKNRPESLHRFPHGIDQPGFFQKNVDASFPEWIATHPVEHKGDTHNYMMIQNKKTLLFVANLGCIEIHPFSSRIKNLNNPDFIIFDLDPEDISFDEVRKAALVLHEVLEEYQIPNYCKTSGATGLHILVPTGAKYDYQQVKLFAELICTLVHSRLPNTTSLERSPSKRQKKVYLDFLQNNFGQTIVSPYCVRPRPFAPVSTPLEWSEVSKKFQPTDFTIKTILPRLEKKGDLFRPVLGKGIDLNKILKLLKS